MTTVRDADAVLRVDSVGTIGEVGGSERTEPSRPGSRLPPLSSTPMFLYRPGSARARLRAAASAVAAAGSTARRAPVTARHIAARICASVTVWTAVTRSRTSENGRAPMRSGRRPSAMVAAAATVTGAPAASAAVRAGTASGSAARTSRSRPSAARHAPARALPPPTGMTSASNGIPAASAWLISSAVAVPWPVTTSGSS